LIFCNFTDISYLYHNGCVVSLQLLMVAFQRMSCLIYLVWSLDSIMRYKTSEQLRWLILIEISDTITQQVDRQYELVTLCNQTTTYTCLSTS